MSEELDHALKAVQRSLTPSDQGATLYRAVCRCGWASSPSMFPSTAMVVHKEHAGWVVRKADA